MILQRNSESLHKRLTEAPTQSIAPDRIVVAQAPPERASDSAEPGFAQKEAKGF